MGRLSKAIQAETEAKFNKGFIPVDLNPIKVREIFDDCFATKDEEDIITSRLITKREGFDEDGTIIIFNYQKLKSHEREIRFLLGQLRVVHENRIIVEVQDMYKKYDGSRWVKDNAILHLCHLASGLSLCSQFEKFDNSIGPYGDLRKEKDIIIVALAYDKLIPTISVSDPNFTAWWEEHHAEWEDPE